MDEPTRDGQPEGWEPDREEDWLFDLPDGARERQESKNRELRERLLRNLEEARQRRFAASNENGDGEEHPALSQEPAKRPDEAEAADGYVDGGLRSSPDQPALPASDPPAGDRQAVDPAEAKASDTSPGEMSLMRKHRGETAPEKPSATEPERSPFAPPEHQSPLSDRWSDLLGGTEDSGSIVEGMRAWVERSRARNQATRMPPVLSEGRHGNEAETADSSPEQPPLPAADGGNADDAHRVARWDEEDEGDIAAEAPTADGSEVDRGFGPLHTSRQGDETVPTSTVQDNVTAQGPEAPTATSAPTYDWDPSPRQDDDWGGEVIGEEVAAGASAEDDPPSTTASADPEPGEGGSADQLALAASSEEGEVPASHTTGSAEPAAEEADGEPAESTDEGPEDTDEVEKRAGSDIGEEFPWKDPREEDSVLVRAFNAHAETASTHDEGADMEKPEPEPSFVDILGDDADELLAEVSGRPRRPAPSAEDWGGSYTSSTPLSPSGDVLFNPSGESVEDEFGVEGATLESAAERNDSGRSLLRNVAETGLLALLVFLAVRVSFQNFRVDGTSMSPTLADGEFLLVNKLVYAEVDMGKLAKFLPFIDAQENEEQFVFHGPHRGDIVVLRDPRRPEQDLIKRIIGLPGETVEVRNGRVFINDFLLEEPYIKSPWNDTRPKIAIPEGQYYVLGDNRNNSLDSRSSQVGLIPKSLILGKALLTYWPFDRFGLAPNSPGTSGGPELTTTRIADFTPAAALTTR